MERSVLLIGSREQYDRDIVRENLTVFGNQFFLKFLRNAIKVLS